MAHIFQAIAPSPENERPLLRKEGARNSDSNDVKELLATILVRGAEREPAEI
jgi:hypothetical protein